jgi:hypothetical protein
MRSICIIVVYSVSLLSFLDLLSNLSLDSPSQGTQASIKFSINLHPLLTLMYTLIHVEVVTKASQVLPLYIVGGFK